MAELIHTFATRVQEDNGTRYVAAAYGEEREDGTWAGWIEFHPEGGTTRVLRTDQETSQPNRTTIEYWASGLEPIYLEGAFERARRNA